MTLNLPKPGGRQRQVLDFVCSGKSNKQIADELGNSQRTVEVHRTLAMRKIGARSSYEAMHLMHTAEVSKLKAEIAELIDFIAKNLPNCTPPRSPATEGQA